MVYGDKVKRAVLSIDMRNELRHLALELGRVRERGRRDLDEHDLAHPLRVVLQQLLERTKLRESALRQPPWASRG